MKSVVRIIAINFAVLLVILLVLEVCLRLATGAPHGRFKPWFPGELGLYPESFEQPNYGVTNWVVKTNAWGFRGKEVTRERVPGRARVVMLGDSMTDGFYVENDFTYPHFTEQFLQAAGVNVEVINGACGGATINRELAIFRDVMVSFTPDIAVLSFVTNDIIGLQEVSDEEVLTQRANASKPVEKVLRFLFVSTAAGELIMDGTMRVISADYAESQRRAAERPVLDPERYNIPGGEAYFENAQRFMKRYAQADVKILTDNFEPEVQQLVARYLRGWDAFVAEARAHGIQPVFAYIPAYPQIYDPSVSLHMRDVLQAHSENAGVPFLDLTLALRQEGANRILHQAPMDFHHNPEGNRVIGQALAEFLVQQHLLPTTH
jgi:lysophospholipase L1-like esterase